MTVKALTLKPNQDVIEQAEALLEDARAGRCQEFVCFASGSLDGRRVAKVYEVGGGTFSDVAWGFESWKLEKLTNG